MHIGFVRILFVTYIFLLIQTNQSLHRYHHHYPRIFRRYLENFLHNTTVLNLSSARPEPNIFFQNEPIPLASSIVDDLTTLASAVYIISLIIIIFVLLVWITHYHAPCSSIITSLLSTVTGLPEPIIHSVALCGSCCVWCETTWLFRRIHQFNLWLSNKIKQFVTVTCKVLYDTICPCCRPPDTPSNRSIIGSLPASIIAIINIPDAPNPSSPKSTVTILEPTAVSSKSLTVNAGLNAQRTTTDSVVEKLDYLVSNTTTVERKINPREINSKKRRKKPRKRTQLKQRSAIGDLSHNEEQIKEMSEDEEEEDDDDDDDNGNTKIY